MEQTDEKGNPLTYWGGLQEIKLKDPNTCEQFKELGCVKDICDCYALIDKFEIIEEIAEKFSNDMADTINTSTGLYNGFIAGYYYAIEQLKKKWQ